MEERILSYIKQYHMINSGDHVMAAVSGGADSVCLLLVLESLRERLDFSLSVFHFNHGLRENAGRDEAFVKELCEIKGIPFYTDKADVGAIAASGDLSIEEAARIERYKALDKAAALAGAQKIAVAHHLMDQAETVLFSLCRGTGLKGLCGMRPVRDNVIRPLLCCSRDEIEAYLENCGQTFVTDETNSDDAYSRNFLRLNIIPELERNINSRASSHIAGAADRLSGVWDYIAQQTKDALSDLRTDTGNISISRLEKYHPVIQKEAVRAFILEKVHTIKDVGQGHIDECLDLCRGQSGKSLDLPGGIKVSKSFDEFCCSSVISENESGMGLADKEFSGRADDGENVSACIMKDELSSEERMICASVGKTAYKVLLKTEDIDDAGEIMKAIPIKRYTKWIDYDKIDGGLEIRSADKDDHLYIDDIHKKPVSEYFKDRKIPLSRRDEIPVIADGDRIICIGDGRISAHVKISKDTRRILKISITEF